MYGAYNKIKEDLIMTKKKTAIEVTKTMTPEEVFDKLTRISTMETKIDTLIVLMRGDDKTGEKGLIEHVKTTNGKVKNVYWIATTALTLTMVVLGFLFQHLSK